MEKELSEMSLGELWELFPIVLVAHNDKWDLFYDEMEVFLRTALAGYPIERISHIGSTAISGIWAKDIVDVLVEVSRCSDIHHTAKAIEQSGFTRMSTATDRISFNHGYTKDGFAEKVYHLHLRYGGDNDELYFRDYLNENPGIAKEYEQLKLSLWRQYRHNRDAYTEAKTEFVKKHTADARARYGNRYE